jgi:hypothetical protein
MPLTRAQAEDFIQKFFRDHRLPAPAVGFRKNYSFTMHRRKRLNLPRVVTRMALANQVAAHLCREVICRDKRMVLETLEANCGAARRATLKRPKYFRISWADFTEWQAYLHGVVVKQFGKGDGLQ